MPKTKKSKKGERETGLSKGILEESGDRKRSKGRRAKGWTARPAESGDGRNRGMAESAGPLFYRRQHPALSDDKGPVVERFAHQLPDSDGRPGHPHRVQDTLAVLRRNGAIDDAALDAGRRFEEQFQRANLNSLHARDLSRISGSGGPDMNEVMIVNRRRVAGAIKLLGGYASPGAAAVWAILGEGRTIKEFAQHSQLGAGRSLDEKVAKGVFVGALAALAAHYGFAR